MQTYLLTHSARSRATDRVSVTPAPAPKPDLGPGPKRKPKKGVNKTKKVMTTPPSFETVGPLSKEAADALLTAMRGVIAKFELTGVLAEPDLIFEVIVAGLTEVAEPHGNKLVLARLLAETVIIVERDPDAEKTVRETARKLCENPRYNNILRALQKHPVLKGALDKVLPPPAGAPTGEKRTSATSPSRSKKGRKKAASAQEKKRQETDRKIVDDISDAVDGHSVETAYKSMTFFDLTRMSALGFAIVLALVGVVMLYDRAASSYLEPADNTQMWTMDQYDTPYSATDEAGLGGQVTKLAYEYLPTYTAVMLNAVLRNPLERFQHAADLLLLQKHDISDLAYATALHVILSAAIIAETVPLLTVGFRGMRSFVKNLVRGIATMQPSATAERWLMAHVDGFLDTMALQASATVTVALGMLTALAAVDAVYEQVTGELLGVLDRDGLQLAGLATLMLRLQASEASTEVVSREDGIKRLSVQSLVIWRTLRDSPSTFITSYMYAAALQALIVYLRSEGASQNMPSL